MAPMRRRIDVDASFHLYVLAGINFMIKTEIRDKLRVLDGRTAPCTAAMDKFR